MMTLLSTVRGAQACAVARQASKDDPVSTTSDDYRDGNYPGVYRHSSTYRAWMPLRAQIAEALKLEPEKIWYFFLAGHIGDHVSGLTLIGAFKQRRGNPPVAIISAGPRDLHALFAHCADLFADVPPSNPGEPHPLARLAELHPLGRFAPGYPIIAEPHFYGDGRLLDLFPVCCFMDVFRFYLRLPKDTPLVPPIVPVAARAAADQAFARAGLPSGRTVLLAPFSNSAPRMPVAWWAAAAEHLKQRGLVPVTNVPNHFGHVRQEAPIPGTIPIDIPLLQVIPFVERAGHFMAVVQGLCDLVSFAKARLKIIYTPCHFLDGLKPEDGGSSTGGYSLVRNFGPAMCDQYDLPTDVPFDPAVLDGWA
jgi:hypothetical protein